MMKHLHLDKITNILIRAFFFCLFPAVWCSAFSAIATIIHSISEGQPLELDSFGIYLIALLIYTVICGRFFCGKACAFGTYGDTVYWIASTIRRKLRKPSPEIPSKLASNARIIRYGVFILVIAGLCLGMEMPPSWTVFSSLTNLTLPSSGVYGVIGFISLLIVTIGMTMVERFYCRFLCPMGTVFSLLPVMPFSIITRDKNECIQGCNACKKVCPAKLNLPYREDFRIESELSDEESRHAKTIGECFQCSKCVKACPKNSATSTCVKNSNSALIADIIKAVILAVILFMIGQSMQQTVI